MTSIRISPQSTRQLMGNKVSEVLKHTKRHAKKTTLKEHMNRIVKWRVVSVGVATVESTLKHISKASKEDVWVFVNECCSKWFLDCAAANTVRQLLANAGGLVLQIPFSSPLARVLKPTWHNEQQEIKLWSALVCRADLLPRCSLIIQGPWNAALLGPTADSPTLFGPGVSSLTELLFNTGEARSVHTNTRAIVPAAVCTHTIHKQ